MIKKLMLVYNTEHEKFNTIQRAKGVLNNIQKKVIIIQNISDNKKLICIMQVRFLFEL